MAIIVNWFVYFLVFVVGMVFVSHCSAFAFNRKLLTVNHAPPNRLSYLYAKAKPKSLISSDLLEKIVALESNSNNDGAHVSAAVDQLPRDQLQATLSKTSTRKQRPLNSKIKVAEHQQQPQFLQLSPHHIGVSFGDTVLIRNASFHVSTGDRVGLVGPNGCGKSTLLKVLTEEVHPTVGEVRKNPSSIRMAFLRQEFVDSLNATNTLRQEISSAFADEHILLDDLKNCRKQTESITDDIHALESLLDRLRHLEEQASLSGAMNLESKIDKIMHVMGFSAQDGDTLVENFSGGWKMKIGLAKLLCQEP
jgi:ABC-type cobalamin/Fe3+-siderophores transport system ATPase subunit